MSTPEYAKVETSAQDCADVLQLYAAMLRQSQQLLTTARNGNWNLLIELEKAYSSTTQTLKEKERECKWSSKAALLKKNELIQAILTSDNETRLLVEPRSQELLQLIASLSTEMKLQKAYQSSGSPLPDKNSS